MISTKTHSIVHDFDDIEDALKKKLWENIVNHRNTKKSDNNHRKMSKGVSRVTVKKDVVPEEWGPLLNFLQLL